MTDREQAVKIADRAFSDYVRSRGEAMVEDLEAAGFQIAPPGAVIVEAVTRQRERETATFTGTTDDGWTCVAGARVQTRVGHRLRCGECNNTGVEQASVKDEAAWFSLSPPACPVCRGYSARADAAIVFGLDLLGTTSWYESHAVMVAAVFPMPEATQ